MSRIFGDSCFVCINEKFIFFSGFVSLFVRFILLHTTIYVAEGRVIEQYKFTVNEYCKQCTPGRHIPYGEMLTYLTELSAINTAEICRFYNVSACSCLSIVTHMVPFFFCDYKPAEKKEI